MSKKSNKDYSNFAHWEIIDQNMRTIMARYQRILHEIYSQGTDVVLFSMTKIRDIQNNWK